MAISIKLKHVLLFAFFFLAGIGSYAQELKVISFQRMDRDLLARTQERKDLNGTPCAVIRVSVKDAQEYFFQGNIIGEVVYNPGEAVVYMTQGSRNLTITSNKFGTLKYDLPTRLEKQVVYRLNLKLIESEANKRRTLVMPLMGVGKDMSYGIMLGVVKKSGFYLKAKYNFKSLAADFDCDNEGYVQSSLGTPWYTGQTQVSRLAVTAGFVQRLALPLHLYAGGGYGFRKLGWETQEGKWANNTESGTTGFEADLGLILRMGNFALTAGIQSNQFKYTEGTIGIGIMF